MQGVAEQYVLLDVAGKEVVGSELLTRDPHWSIPTGSILIARDSKHHRHILIPIDEPLEEDTSSQGVTLSERVLEVTEGQTQAYADLSCRMKPLDLVFERLVEDVLARLEHDPSQPAKTCRQALEDWRSLLRTASSDVARETIIGIIGELELLRLLAEESSQSILDIWRGPDGSIHDFVLGRTEVEVKATASIEGSTISISNIDQLDPTLVGELYLVVVHLTSDETAPSLDERIEGLIDLGVPKDELLKRVQLAGYVFESKPKADDRFTVKSVRCWRVTDDFPGLRSDDIPQERHIGVSGIQYRLNLDTAPHQIDELVFQQLIGDWSQFSS